MKQTSVEWLFKNIWLNPPENLLEILDKAKELENRQKDDYAIEFAEWLPNNAYKESKCWRMFDKKDNEYTTQELLEIFKKEKGL